MSILEPPRTPETLAKIVTAPFADVEVDVTATIAFKYKVKVPAELYDTLKRDREAEVCTVETIEASDAYDALITKTALEVCDSIGGSYLVDLEYNN